MILLDEDTQRLLEEAVGSIDKDGMLANWEALMELAPIHSGTTRELQAMEFLKGRLEAYGYDCRMHWFDAYLSEPKYARLRILEPVEEEIQATPYRQVGTTTPEGFEAEMVYLPPEELGLVDCRGKVVLCEQRTSGDWMGLRNGFLLRLQEMGVKGLVVIEQDDYVDTVCHQRADFSVSGNPTSDNIHLVQTIPAILHVSNRDGQKLRQMVLGGGVRVHIVSVVETGWKRVPLVEAELRGSVEPERFILVNAHVDTPPFSPGVVDNLSGNVALLEVARILKKYQHRLRRSIRFAFWPGHEIGRYAGSTWYNDAFWMDLRHNCVASYNIDSPGAEGATEFRSLQITELLEAAQESVVAVQGKPVETLRWATRAGDGSFWGTGVTHVSITTSRPPQLYDPHVNYSGGGWWWHTPYATMEHGDVDVLEKDVQAELNFVIRVANSVVLPYNFKPLAERLLEVLRGYQERAEKVRPYFNLDPVLERAERFLELSGVLEEKLRENASRLGEEELWEVNECLLWASRHVNLVAHSNAGPSEQMSMETFGATPLPRIAEVVKLAEMTLHQSHQFKLLKAKLLRQRNAVEEGFYQANKLIEKALAKLG